MRLKNMLLCLVVLLFTFAAITGVSLAPTGTILYVDPPVTTGVEVGNNFSVEVKVENVTDLYGWSYNLLFRADVVQVANIAFSTWMADSSGFAATSVQNIDNTAGKAYMGQILHPLATNGATGDGLLATVTFDVASVGATYLTLDTSKLNKKLYGNNVPIPHIAEHGLFDNRPEMLPPIASFVGPTSGVAGETLAFDASASNDGADNGWIVSHEWDFSYSRTFNPEATGDIVTHVFGSKGSYTVALRVTDNDGMTDIATLDITILTEASYFPDLAGKKAWPSHHHFVEAKHGSINVLYARIKNPNTMAAFEVYVRFSAYDAKYGMIAGSVFSPTVTLSPGEMVDVTADFDINAAEFQTITKAYVLAELFYFDEELGWVESGLDKWFGFAIVRI